MREILPANSSTADFPTKRSKKTCATTGFGFSRKHCRAFLPALTLALTLALAHSGKMKPRFDHEKLNVYQASLAFITWATELISKAAAKAAVKDQLDRASTSIPLNIAEGNGKFTIKDRCRFSRFCSRFGARMRSVFGCPGCEAFDRCCRGSFGKGAVVRDRLDVDGSHQ